MRPGVHPPVTTLPALKKFESPTLIRLKSQRKLASDMMSLLRHYLEAMLGLASALYFYIHRVKFRCSITMYFLISMLG